jgi:hypothetical protein
MAARREGIPQGAKAPSIAVLEAKAEALAYIEAEGSFVRRVLISLKDLS